MAANFNKAAEEFISSGTFGEKRGSIENAASSPAGQRVKAMLEQGGFENAVKNGDAAALGKVLSGVMSTNDGAELLRELERIMGK